MSNSMTGLFSQFIVHLLSKVVVLKAVGVTIKILHLTIVILSFKEVDGVISPVAGRTDHPIIIIKKS